MFKFTNSDVKERYNGLDDVTREKFEKWVSSAGRNWKSELRYIWMHGRDHVTFMRTVRNVIGPNDLDQMQVK